MARTIYNGKINKTDWASIMIVASLFHWIHNKVFFPYELSKVIATHWYLPSILTNWPNNKIYLQYINWKIWTEPEGLSASATFQNTYFPLFVPIAVAPSLKWSWRFLSSTFVSTFMKSYIPTKKSKLNASTLLVINSASSLANF